MIKIYIINKKCETKLENTNKNVSHIEMIENDITFSSNKEIYQRKLLYEHIGIRIKCRRVDVAYEKTR